MLPDRIVHFRPRTIFAAAGILLLVAIVLWVVWISRHVLTWVLISLFLTLALNPFVDWLQRRGVRPRGAAVGIAYLVALGAIAGLAALVVPTLVEQVNHFAHKVPDYVDELTKGRGRLGFLERKYHVVERVRSAVASGGVKRVVGLGSAAALSATKSVLTAIAATVAILFMTLFMLLEGPQWMERIYGLVPEEKQPRWRAVGRDVYRAVGGYVNGNLLISLIAGTAAGVVLFVVGVPYAVALALVVGVFDLIPLAGATIAAIVVVLVAFAANGLTAAIVVAIYFVVYQQLENHLLQPLVYGRTVQLSPLAVLVAVLVGAEVAGILGALGAIPVAGAIQVLIVDWQRHRRSAVAEPPQSDSAAPRPSGDDQGPGLPDVASQLPTLEQ